jgi:hypothetical protein
MTPTGSTCSSCGAPIVWAETEAGRPIPLDRAPRTAGNIVQTDLDLFHDPTGPIRVRYLRRDEPHDGPRYVSHFATCPDAAFHRRPK